MNEIIITVTDANNTYTARANGQSASNTAGAFQAASTLATKLLNVQLQGLYITRLQDNHKKQQCYAVRKLAKRKP
jgi:hypothetical protein